MSSKIKKLMTDGQSRINKQIKEELPREIKTDPVKQDCVNHDNAKKNESTKDANIKTESIPPAVRENLDILIQTDIAPEDLKTFAALSDKQKKALKLLEQCGPAGIDALCQMTDDETYVRAVKLMLLSFMNDLSRRELFRKFLKKFTAAIQKIKNFREMFSQ